MATSALSARSAAVTISRDGVPTGSLLAWPSPGRASWCSGCMGSAAPRARRRTGKHNSWAEGNSISMIKAKVSAGEGGRPRPILDEPAHSRAPVLGREQAREVEPLDLQARGQAGIQAVVDRLLGGA